MGIDKFCHMYGICVLYRAHGESALILVTCLVGSPVAKYTMRNCPLRKLHHAKFSENIFSNYYKLDVFVVNYNLKHQGLTFFTAFCVLSFSTTTQTIIKTSIKSKVYWNEFNSPENQHLQHLAIFVGILQVFATSPKDCKYKFAIFERNKRQF